MQHPLLQKFSLISEVLLTNQSGFPFCELILKPSNPNGFSDLYSFLQTTRVLVRLTGLNLTLEIPDHDFSWQSSRSLSTDEADLLKSQRHPKLIIYFVAEIYGSRYKAVIPGADGRIKPLLAEFIRDSAN